MKKNIILTITLLLLMFIFLGCNEGENFSKRTFKITGETQLTEGQTLEISVEGFDNESITWTSSNSTVLTVSAGHVSGINYGTATVTARYGGYGDSIEITVSEVGRAVDPVVDAAVNSVLDNMSLEQKIGQLFMVGISEDTFTNDDIDNLEGYYFGNYYLNRNNISSAESLTNLTKTIQRKVKSNNGVYAFIATTKTFGDRNELSSIFAENLPCNKIVGNSKSAGDAYIAGKLIGNELASYGINFDFIYSLNSETGQGRYETPITLDAFNSSPKITSEYAVQYIKGINETNVLACGGLFPVFNSSEISQGLQSEYFNVFREAFANGLDGLMINDVKYTLVDDDNPATISYSIINNKLIGEFKYSGLVVTVDMNDFSIRYRSDAELYTKPAILAITAGVNLFYFSSVSELCIDYFNDIYEAVQTDLITEEMIDAACYKVLEMKYHYGVLDYKESNITGSYDYSQMNSYITSMDPYKLINYSEFDFDSLGKDEKVYIFSYEYDFSSGAESVGEELVNYLVSKGYNRSNFRTYSANELNTVGNLLRKKSRKDWGDPTEYDRIIIIASPYESQRGYSIRKVPNNFSDLDNIYFIGIGSTSSADYFNEIWPSMILYGTGENDLKAIFRYLAGETK